MPRTRSAMRGPAPGRRSCQNTPARRSRAISGWPRLPPAPTLIAAQTKQLPAMDNKLDSAKVSLGLEKYARHILLCADQTEPNCAPKEKGLESWEFLKRRLQELHLVGPEPLVYRSK